MVLTAAHIQPIVALIAGILILLMPRLLNLIVAIYLIFVGLAGLGVLRMLHISEPPKIPRNLRQPAQTWCKAATFLSFPLAD
ncbi:MAG: hypothetical protein JWP84_1265 [Tardiphaga sp.]|nr:hypothetical protein [Tardiphaga sp.]